MSGSKDCRKLLKTFLVILALHPVKTQIKRKYGKKVKNRNQEKEELRWVKLKATAWMVFYFYFYLLNLKPKLNEFM